MTIFNQVNDLPYVFLGNVVRSAFILGRLFLPFSGLWFLFMF